MDHLFNIFYVKHKFNGGRGTISLGGGGKYLIAIPEGFGRGGGDYFRKICTPYQKKKAGSGDWG